MTVDRRIIDLYNEYVHTALPRREFMTRLASIAGGTAAALAILPFVEQSYCAFRVANASMGETKSNVSIHLATARQVIDLGPVMVFNFGKGYDTKKLAFCSG